MTHHPFCRQNYQQQNDQGWPFCSQNYVQIIPCALHLNHSEDQKNCISNPTQRSPAPAPAPAPSPSAAAEVEVEVEVWFLSFNSTHLAKNPNQN
jgi:hypothetical protein